LWLEEKGNKQKALFTAAVSEIPDSYATEKDSAPQESQHLHLFILSTATGPSNNDEKAQEILVIPVCSAT
jgi:hypothetical protein